MTVITVYHLKMALGPKLVVAATIEEEEERKEQEEGEEDRCFDSNK
jgi:hypothetical protein